MTQHFYSWVFAQGKWKHAHKKIHTEKLTASLVVIPENWQQPKSQTQESAVTLQCIHRLEHYIAIKNELPIRGWNSENIMLNKSG